MSCSQRSRQTGRSVSQRRLESSLSGDKCGRQASTGWFKKKEGRQKLQREKEGDGRKRKQRRA